VERIEKHQLAHVSFPLRAQILLANLMSNTESTPSDHVLTLVEESPHRFIDNLDVVLELCELLSNLRWKKSLLAFGSTCKALFEPAMDVLWYRLHDIINLLKVISNFVRVDNHLVYSISSNCFHTSNPLTQTIEGPLSDSILTRFDTYARRVRVLDGDSLLSEASKLTSIACTYLTSFRCPLVPYLREFRISSCDERDCGILLLLGTTKLKIVDLGYETHGEGGRMTEAFLHSIQCDKAHGLEKLRISTARRNHVDLITKFHMLQDVELRFDENTTGALLVEGFSKLSALHRLSRLYLEWDVGSEHHSLVPALRRHSITFQSLHSFEIMVPTYMALLLVQCMMADTLKRVQVTVNCRASPLHQSTAFRQIVDECGFITPDLEEVDFDFDYDNRSIGRETWDAVINLTQRFRLRTIKFAWFGLEIDDTYILKACLSGCFSHLEVLNLVTSGSSPSPTFQVLRSLAIHCPHLKDLDLTFTVEEEHLPLLIEEMENEHSLSHCLRSLVVHLKDKPETKRFLANWESIPIVSQYLDSLFPSLDYDNIRGGPQYSAFIKGIRRSLKGLQYTSILNSTRLVGSQVINL